MFRLVLASGGVLTHPPGPKRAIFGLFSRWFRLKTPLKSALFSPPGGVWTPFWADFGAIFGSIRAISCPAITADYRLKIFTKKPLVKPPN